KLANPVVEVLLEPVAETNQLTQLLGHGVRQAARCRPLLSSEARDAEGINCIGLGALEILSSEAVSPQWIEQRDRETIGHQEGEQVLPVVASRFHRDERLIAGADELEQLGVASDVLGELFGLHQHLGSLVDYGDNMCFRRDIDSNELHDAAP